MGKKPNHFLVEYSELMHEWDYEKNNALGLDPSRLGACSHTKAWWRCSNGHSWYAMISNRTGHNRGCPYCSHQLVIPGETDLATLYPSLAEEWHPTKNSTKPSDYMPGTHKKVWWICSEGHEWEAEIKSRVAGVGCPYCANKKIIEGYNDLQTINPDLASEWHPTKNYPLKPSDVSPVSGKKVWWVCSYGHEYEAQICNRSAGRGCPKCSDMLRTSFPEQAIFYYIKQVFPDAINSYKEIFDHSMELDIFIPSLNIGIEYDGKMYHNSQRNQIRDARKYRICKSHGIQLIRVREICKFTPLLLCDHKLEIPDASDKSLNWAINNLCYYLGKLVVPDVRKDRKQIMSYLNTRKTSLASEYPEIAAEWDYDTNYPLLPENFPPHSNERASWVCKTCGRKWSAAIGDRTRANKTGCPDCGRKRGAAQRKKRKLDNSGSIADLYPELMEEWDYQKNKELSPNSITPESAIKVGWICKTCGYTWDSAVSHRAKGEGCPYCAHRVVVPGKNDLATLYPKLITEWDYEENSKNNLDPTMLAAHSGKKANWVCSVCGHKWAAVIATRTAGSGCPKARVHAPVENTHVPTL